MSASNGRHIIVFGLILCSILSFGQHEQQYSQFMYNKLIFNPAYAGSTDDLTVTASYRNQWMGFEGAPVNMGISVDGSLKEDKIGLGLNIFRRTIGIYDNWTMDGIYAYKLKVGENSTLSAGLQASLRYYGANFADQRLRGSQDISIDPSIPQEQIADLAANFGFGLYFSSPTFYAGLSVPRLLASEIDFLDREIPLSLESRHAFLMSGLNVRLSSIWEWTPQILVKYVSNAPLSFEAYNGFTVLERYTVGLGYRSGGLSSSLGESIDVLLGFQLTRQLFMAFTYDILLSPIRNHSSGSIEAVVRYSFIKEADRPQQIINPRYF